MKAYWGSEGIALRFLNLGIRWRWVGIKTTDQPKAVRNEVRRIISKKSACNYKVHKLLSSSLLYKHDQDI